MKRIVLTMSLLCGFVLSSSGAQAAGQPTLQTMRTLARQLGTGQTARSLALHNFVHADQSACNPVVSSVNGLVTSAPQLRLLPSTYPSTFSVVDNGPINACDADQKVVSVAHTTPYEQLGMLGGWYQLFGKQLTNGLFGLMYLGSYYQTSDQAKNAWNDSRPELATSPSSCSFGNECQQFQFEYTPNLVVYEYVIRKVIISNAVFEGGYFVDQADFAAQQAAGNQYLDAMTQAWVNQVKNPPTVTPPTTTPPTTTPPTTTPTPPTVTPTPTTPTPTVINYHVPDNLWPSGSKITESTTNPSDTQINAFHSARPLSQLGRVPGQGYDEGVTWSGTSKQKVKCPKGSKKKTCTKTVKHNLAFTYLASVFTSGSGAQTAFADAEQALPATNIANQLPSRVGDQMYAVIGSDSKDKLQIGALFFVRGRVLVEMIDASGLKDKKYRDLGLILEDQKVATWLDNQAKQQG